MENNTNEYSKRQEILEKYDFATKVIGLKAVEKSYSKTTNKMTIEMNHTYFMTQEEYQPIKNYLEWFFDREIKTMQQYYDTKENYNYYTVITF